MTDEERDALLVAMGAGLSELLTHAAVHIDWSMEGAESLSRRLDAARDALRMVLEREAR